MAAHTKTAFHSVNRWFIVWRQFFHRRRLSQKWLSKTIAELPKKKFRNARSETLTTTTKKGRQKLWGSCFQRRFRGNWFQGRGETNRQATSLIGFPQPTFRLSFFFFSLIILYLYSKCLFFIPFKLHLHLQASFTQLQIYQHDVIQYILKWMTEWLRLDWLVD